MKHQILTTLIGANIILFLSSRTSQIKALSSVETTARKSLGKKSFIHKQARGQLPTTSIVTPDEIQDLTIKCALKRPGSKQYRKAWKRWVSVSTRAIQYELSSKNNLPTPVDRARFENLFFRLGVAADQGVPPSFADAGARSAYALDYLYGDSDGSLLCHYSRGRGRCYW